MVSFGLASKSGQGLILLQIIFILIINSPQVTHGAKILVFIGISSHSHRVAIAPLATKLAEIGHDVTFLSPIAPEEKNPKIKEFCPKRLLKFNEQLHRDFGNDPVTARLADKRSNVFLDDFGLSMWDLQYKSHVATVKSPDFGTWLNKSTFDLIISEHPMKEIVFGIAHAKGAKVIGFSPSPIMSTEAEMFGWPTESSWLPDMAMGSSLRWIPERFSYEINYLLWSWSYKWLYLPKVNALMKKHFGKETPEVEDLVRNTSLLLVNTHLSHEYARSLPPFVIPVGGMHVKETVKPLPKNLEDFISSGTDGFVYISFGSVLQISALPEKTRKSFFEVIETFPNARFLIKWNNEVPKDIPKNVLPMKWFPQQDILAHPKCRGFVSQGGLMSYQQATYFGVPVIVMPVFGDQPFNARAAAHQGMGIHLELADLTFDTFSDAIRRVLYSDELSLKAKEVSRRFKDRPMSPLDTAVWWTEYVLRHNDTSHMKPLGIHQAWWQRRLLDFWFFVFTGQALIGLITFFGIRQLVRICLKTITKPQNKIKCS